MYEAIILAGGFGTRLRQIVPDVPKPMAPINGKPFLEILLKSLVQKNFSRIILSVGFMAEKIIEYFGNKFLNTDLVYTIEDSPLGTGGAIRLSLEKSLQDHVFIFNGDTYLDLEIEKVEQLWQKTRSPVIVGREVDDAFRYGRLLLDNDGKIQGFTEKGLSGRGIINAGSYVIKKDQLNQFPLYSSFSFETDYLADANNRLLFTTYISQAEFIDIGVPEDYMRAQAELAEK